MRMHVYEFRSEKKKLKCSCGWERTLKSSEDKLIRETFQAHSAEEAVKAAA
ncbi:MAG: hypothetical protein M0D55_07890 [Elusimicrobiota bacterium]|nr:MAG: hypothetical protein M0D55_07890 [Elusimicrobiota bacterium]